MQKHFSFGQAKYRQPGKHVGNSGPLNSHLLAFQAPYSKHRSGSCWVCQTCSAAPEVSNPKSDLCDTAVYIHQNMPLVSRGLHLKVEWVQVLVCMVNLHCPDNTQNTRLDLDHNWCVRKLRNITRQG